MRQVFLFLLSFLASCSPCCFAQVSYNKEYKDHEPIVIKLDAEPEPGVKRTVLWDANFTFIEAPGTLYGWAAPGQYKFSGTVFTTKDLELNGTTYSVLVGVPSVVRGEFSVGGSNPTPNPNPTPGPTPTPGPGPNPNGCDGVSSDSFDNLGKRVCSWSAGLPKKAEVAAVFEKYAGRLMKDPSTTINSVSTELIAEREAVLGSDAASYKPLMDDVQTELNARWPMSKGTMANFYMAIAAGLKGA